MNVPILPMRRDQFILRVVKPALFALALVPLAHIVWDGFGDGLGANPVQQIEFRTGLWGLRLIIATLCVTPLRRLTGWLVLTRLRRMIGLFAFFYLCLHFLTYFVLDAGLDLGYIVDDVAKRRYITVGFTSFVLLVPLAITSTNAMVRRLGPARWRALHRLVYAVAIGGCLHYLWLVKADVRPPLGYLAVVVVLLALRLPPVAARLRPLRRRAPAAPRQRAAADGAA